MGENSDMPRLKVEVKQCKFHKKKKGKEEEGNKENIALPERN